jgi:antirestriction protein ArdC
VQNLINLIQAEPLKWRKTWSDARALGVAQNGYSKVRYNRLNQANLTFVSARKNYTDPRWFTFKQVKDFQKSHPNVHVKAGEHGEIISFWSFYDKAKRQLIDSEASVDNPKDLGVVLKYSTVFNVAQIEGMKEALPVLEVVEQANFTNEKMQNFQKNCFVSIQEDLSYRASYNPSEDTVHMPPIQGFLDLDPKNGENKYYGTLLHELSHATGHETRLKREIENTFGTKKYAIEEITAELSSLLCEMNLDLWFDNSEEDESNLQNHFAYLQNWGQEISTKPEVIDKIVRNAERASKYITDYYHQLEENQAPVKNIIDQAWTESSADDDTEENEKGEEE